MEEIFAKFVSQKISKTRWRPVPFGSLQPPETFATGSWDNEENSVSLWCIGDFGNLSTDGGLEGDHQLLCDIKHHGDVMDLQFLDQERIVAASSTGCVSVFLHHPNNQILSVSQEWAGAHYHIGPGSPSYRSAPCTGIVCNSPEIVTVGEDGRINLFRVGYKEAVLTIETRWRRCRWRPGTEGRVWSLRPLPPPCYVPRWLAAPPPAFGPGAARILGDPARVRVSAIAGPPTRRRRRFGVPLSCR
ncbi:nucleoporin Nup43 [Gracilinanus agilis]|uniref:nucleoporin Nup43 n=1 Tax=Gracilinanus agilis TaxID=191870 RepID=UPI001CFCD655|nr:nucleoporin Nup43 [Gracilinanus agilis]